MYERGHSNRDDRFTRYTLFLDRWATIFTTSKIALNTTNETKTDWTSADTYTLLILTIRRILFHFIFFIFVEICACVGLMIGLGFIFGQHHFRCRKTSISSHMEALELIHLLSKLRVFRIQNLRFFLVGFRRTLNERMRCRKCGFYGQKRCPNNF